MLCRPFHFFPIVLPGCRLKHAAIFKVARQLVDLPRPRVTQAAAARRLHSDGLAGLQRQQLLFWRHLFFAIGAVVAHNPAIAAGFATVIPFRCRNVAVSTARERRAVFQNSNVSGDAHTPAVPACAAGIDDQRVFLDHQRIFMLNGFRRHVERVCDMAMRPVHTIQGVTGTVPTREGLQVDVGTVVLLRVSGKHHCAKHVVAGRHSFLRR